MNLGSPGPTYSAENEAQARAEIAREDRRNVKKSTLPVSVTAGVTASIATGAPTTIGTAVAGRTAVAVYLSGAANYTAASDVISDGTVTNIALVYVTGGAQLTITLSGLNIQVTQNSGLNQVVNYSLTRTAF